MSPTGRRKAMAVNTLTISLDEMRFSIFKKLFLENWSYNSNYKMSTTKHRDVFILHSLYYDGHIFQTDIT